MAVCLGGIFYYPLIWPIVLDILLHKNESRSHSEILTATEYFIDQERYFYLIVIHGCVAGAVGIMALLATGTMLIMCFQHAYGMFRIAR